MFIHDVLATDSTYRSHGFNLFLSICISDADAVTNYNSAHVLSPQTGPRGGKPAQIENTSQLHESPDLEEAYSLHGM